MATGHSDQDTDASRRFLGLPPSVVTALIILAAVIAYFAIGTIMAGNDDAPAASASEAREEFVVLVQDIAPTEHQDVISLRGRTEAGRRVTVRAQTPGQVAAMPISEGTMVKEGDIICRLDVDSRRAVLEEARAAYTKAQTDFDAASRLHEEGFASDAALKSARAQRDGAAARLSRARLDLANTDVAAPFDGVLSETLVEPGDVLAAGAPCAIVADLSNIIVAGGVGADEAATLNPGDRAQVTLSDSRQFAATVSYVANVADDRTRAFRVELTAVNDEDIPAGLAAEAAITTGQGQAALVPRNALVFNDSGALGVRIIEPTSTDHGTVRFMPVSLSGEVDDGAYVTGLDGQALVVVRGQDYVQQGNEVAFTTARNGSMQ
ncbi:efflux RND transporter periplasmic adaptor subunit [Parvularcula sp. LCG005]|uniref:efflux RND transporter periplasmic adaptor subunit n=1 Tax=Parvularcula sp. LCG005 TaxID=3078805 RepID=UPI0029433E42|nr:efflux RND transporter periplasmic adaptor subunit [Parvularcula sp. LCG005]WOI53768.1 efflux RND transporter periplasmic adaptor subunit [Parvularcula sp. LCG005]